MVQKYGGTNFIPSYYSELISGKGIHPQCKITWRIMCTLICILRVILASCWGARGFRRRGPPLLNFVVKRSVRATNHSVSICQASSSFGILFPDLLTRCIFLLPTMDAICLSQQPAKLPKRGANATWALRPFLALRGTFRRLLLSCMSSRAYFCKVRKSRYCAALQ